ncbi:cell division protein YceG involved in septum cleavage [Spirosoma lacussanchae]|uniref:T9SS C-terminal target domain-containing protein n=1 Tax=Spirosoma lacussanchae TaxID=1884249 RepID=UPI001108A116|nr:T9SS C-terminal target domain-containing protein [Spirosoma lacussanchae]
MKKVFVLMLGLVAGTASFAQTTADKAPVTYVSVTTDKKIQLVVGREEATATVSLRDEQGRILYAQNVNLRDGLHQYFNIAELANGTYQLAVRVGKEQIVKTFVVGEQPAQKVVAFES